MGLFGKFKKKEEKKEAGQKPAKVVDEKKTKKDVSEVKPRKSAAIKSPKKEGDVKSNKKQDLNGILIRPLITEKATALNQLNKYAFEVSVRANKIQIADAIDQRYNVRPSSVNVINNRGRQVRFGKSSGTTRSWKKAIVTLPEGKTIQLHEGV